MVRAIDTFVNVDWGNTGKPEWLVRVAEDYFKNADEIFKPVTMPELIDAMDRAGVEKCIVTTGAEEPTEHALSFPRMHPERFVLSVSLDPRRGMHAVRALERMVRDEPVVLARITPFMINLPPDDRVYYPVYAKCIELDVPIAINTGIPGPPMPGKCQDPMYLDEVCVFFPELKLVMAHGADPWWSVAIRLMIKYQNLRLMTSAWSPKRLPESLLHYMRTRGSNKVMYASDWPVLKMRRVVPEARALDLPADVLDNYLYNNAHEFFFGAKQEH